MKKAIAFAAVAALTLAACGSDEETTETDMTEETSDMSTEETAAGDIVAVASSTEGFSTLVAALEAAGLVETLQGEGPFTVFAPTDDAFAALPEGLLEKLLLPENVAVLTSILTYHVVPGKVMAADVVKVKSAKSVQGGDIAVKVSGGKVKAERELVAPEPRSVVLKVTPRTTSLVRLLTQPSIA